MGCTVTNVGTTFVTRFRFNGHLSRFNGYATLALVRRPALATTEVDPFGLIFFLKEGVYSFLHPKSSEFRPSVAKKIVLHCGHGIDNRVETFIFLQKPVFG